MAGKVYMAELKVIRSELGGFQTNCYIVANELSPQRVRSLLLPKPKKKVDDRQLVLDFGE